MGQSGAKAIVIPIYDGDIIDQQIEAKQSFVLFVKDAKYTEAHEEEEHLFNVRGIDMPIYTISFDNARKNKNLKDLIKTIEDKTTYDAHVLYIVYKNGQLSNYTNRPLLETGSDLRFFIMKQGDYLPFRRLKYGAKYYEEERKKYIKENGKGGGGGGGSSDSGLQLQYLGGPVGGIGYGSKGFGMNLGGGLGWKF